MDVFGGQQTETYPGGSMKTPTLPDLACPQCPTGTPLVFGRAGSARIEDAHGKPFTWSAVEAHCTGCHEDHRITVDPESTAADRVGPERCVGCGFTPVAVG